MVACILAKDSARVRFSLPAPNFALVTELAYVLVLKAEFCGFESHPGYQNKNAPVAQLDRALVYEAEGWGFESLRARQFNAWLPERLRAISTRWMMLVRVQHQVPW